MKKIALFVEGQTELIFVRNLILKLFDYNISFTCCKLHAKKFCEVPYSYENPNARLNCFIVNAQSDESVISAIKSHEERFFKEKKYDLIIGLRDMYSEKYKKRSLIVDSNLNKSFIDGANSIITRMSQPDKIKIFFSIMEIEAWFLSMSDMFCRKFGKGSFVFNDPVENVFHPASRFIEILGSFNLKYKKRESDIESLISKIEDVDIDECKEKSQSFKAFYNELISLKDLTEQS